MKNKYIFLKMLLALFFAGAMVNLNAQTSLLGDVVVSVIQVTHDEDCCSDQGLNDCGGGFLGGNPDPRWDFRIGYNNMGLGQPIIFSGGNNNDCGIEPVNQILSTENAFCLEEINLRIESWEEDNVTFGEDDEYNCGFPVVPCDEHHSIDLYTILLADLIEGANDTILTQVDNNYTTTIRVEWVSHEPIVEVSPSLPICEGESVTLEINPVNPDYIVYNWFWGCSTSISSTSIGSGTSIDIGPLSNSTDVTVVGTNGFCNSEPTCITIPVTNTFSAPTVDDTNPFVCQGEDATITILSGFTVSPGNEFQWFDNPGLTGIPNVVTGSTIVLPITQNSTIYIIETDGSCVGDPTVVNIQLYPITLPPIAPDTIRTCPNGQATLTATTGGSNGVIKWYDSPVLEDVNEVPAITDPLLDNPLGYCYWATETDPITGCESEGVKVVVTTDLMIDPPTVPDVTICSGESATIMAISNNSTTGTFGWHPDMSTGAVFTGNPFVTAPLYSNTVFYVVENINGCLSSPVAVNVFVNPKPVAPVGTNDTICSGETAIFAVADNGGDIQWYYDAGGEFEIPLATSDTYMESLFSTVTYYAGETNGFGCESDLTPVTVTVLPLPSPPSTSAITICEGEIDSLTASVGVFDGTITWYNSAGVLLEEDEVLPQTAYFALSADTLTIGANTYYVSYTNTEECESQWVTVSVNVTPKPAAPNVPDVIVCEGDYATFTGQGALNWYTDMTDASIDLVGSATYTTTDPITATTSFYVSQVVNGCESDKVEVMAVLAPDVADPMISSNGSICVGDDIILTVNPVSPPLSIICYGQDGSELPSNTFTSTSIGTFFYTCVVTDTNTGCTASSTTSVEVLPVPQSAPLFSNSPVCSGDDIVLTTGTVSGATYIWAGPSIITGINDSTIVPTYTIANATLAYSGTYTVTIFTGGCDPTPSSTEVIVTDTPVAPTASDISVCEGENVILTATGTNGVLNYYYQGSPISPLIGTGLAPDTYNYMVTESIDGCESDSTEIEVVVAPAPQVPITSNIEVCVNELYDLTAILTGTPTWFEADGTTSIGITTGLSQSMAGIYVYYVTQSDGTCTSEQSSLVVTVNESPAAAPVASDITTCYGEFVTLSATAGSGGTLNYYYGGVSISPLIGTDLAPDTYNYMVTESIDGCESDSTEIEVVVAPVPQAPITSDIEVCVNELYDLTATLTGTPAWFEFDGTTSTSIGTTTGLSQNMAGIYVYHVTQSDGTCTSEQSSLVVTVNESPAAAPVASDITACYGEFVTLSATAGSGGTLNYYYGGVSISPLIGADLTAGTHNYMVTESIGDCESDSTEIEVFIQGALETPIVSNIEACEGETVILSSLTTGVEWYLSSDLSGTPVPATQSSLPLGPTPFYAVQTNGTCYSEVSTLVVTVSEGAFGTPSPANSTIEVCVGESVTLSVTGSGTGDITYYENNIEISPYLGIQGEEVVRTFTATEGNGICESGNPAEITLIVNGTPIINSEIADVDPLCIGETLTINAPGTNISGATYEWILPNNLGTETMNPLVIPNVTNLHEGIYELIAISPEGCRAEFDSKFVFVYVNEIPPGITVSNNGPVCEGGTINLTATGIFGATYLWSGGLLNGTTGVGQNIEIPNATAADEDTYTLEVTIEGCTSNSALLFTDVIVNGGPTISAGADIQVTQGSNATLQGSGGINFVWTANNASDLAYLSNTNVSNPIFNNAPIGTYTYTVTGYDANLCSGTDEVIVTVIPNEDLEIVDLITPNGDGVNDTWKITYLENLKGYTLKIYARGGVQILETSNYNNDWDGTYEGKDLPDGTYWYVVKSDDGATYKGAISIKR